jgi:hypothetical protein
MIPAKYKDIFKANRELQDIYVASKLFKQEFPGGLREARGLKQTVEKFGGVEGLQTLKEESTYLNELDSQFIASDPKMLDTLAKANPEATVDLIVLGIAKLKSFSPEQYNHTLGGIVFNTLAGADAMHDAYNVLLGMKDNPAAQEAAKALGQWYNNIRQIAEKAPEKREADQKTQLQKDREKFESDKSTHEANQRIEAVNNAVRPELISNVGKVLAQEMKAVGKDAAKLKAANPKLYNRIVANVMQEIKARVLSDDTFKKNYEAVLLVEKNPQKAIKMANAKNSKVAAQAVRDVWNEFAALVDKKPAGSTTNNQNAGGKQTANPGRVSEGFKMVDKMPDRFAIDWNRSNHLVVDGKAILKSGEKVQWRI